jgi:hypothetical protein
LYSTLLYLLGLIVVWYLSMLNMLHTCGIGEGGAQWDGMPVARGRRGAGAAEEPASASGGIGGLPASVFQALRKAFVLASSYGPSFLASDAGRTALGGDAVHSKEAQSEARLDTLFQRIALGLLHLEAQEEEDDSAEAVRAVSGLDVKSGANLGTVPGMNPQFAPPNGDSEARRLQDVEDAVAALEEALASLRRSQSGAPIHTQQTCYVSPDESELCVYDGPICFDGEYIVVSVSKTPSLYGQPLSDGTTMCADYRFYDLSAPDFDRCVYADSSQRPYPFPPLRFGERDVDMGFHSIQERYMAQEASGDKEKADKTAAEYATRFSYLKTPPAVHPPMDADPKHDHSLPLRGRRWGPIARSGDMWFREVTPSDLGLGLDAASYRRYPSDAEPDTAAPSRGREDRALAKGAVEPSAKGRLRLRNGEDGDRVAAAKKRRPRRRSASPVPPSAAPLGEDGLPNPDRPAPGELPSPTPFVYIQVDPSGTRVEEEEGPQPLGLVAGLTVAKRTHITADVATAHIAPDDVSYLVSNSVPVGFRQQQTTVDDRVINWLDGPLWLAGVEVGSHENPFHWMSKVGMLFDAQRSNATTEWGKGPRDGYLQRTVSTSFSDGPSIATAEEIEEWSRTGRPSYTVGEGEEQGERDPISFPEKTQNRMTWRTGAQWTGIPSQDYVVFTGPGTQDFETESSLTDWFQAVLRLGIQRHSKVFARNLTTSLSSENMLCSMKGAVIGAKHRVFTSRADHWMFRAYAYDALGLLSKGLQPHTRYPPRTITVFDRGTQYGRKIHNDAALKDLLESTGLPVRWVEDARYLTAAEQIELMADTGILIASHGAAIANAIFMPAHGVIVELFPYLMKKQTYANLATITGHVYMPLYSWETLDPVADPSLAKLYYGVDLMQQDYFKKECIGQNISSFDANTVHACNGASKYYPIVVPMTRMQEVLRDALDAIGAFNPSNPSWAAIRNAASEGSKDA